MHHFLNIWYISLLYIPKRSILGHDGFTEGIEDGKMEESFL